MKFMRDWNSFQNTTSAIAAKRIAKVSHGNPSLRFYMSSLLTMALSAHLIGDVRIVNVVSAFHVVAELVIAAIRWIVIFDHAASLKAQRFERRMVAR